MSCMDKIIQNTSSKHTAATMSQRLWPQRSPMSFQHLQRNRCVYICCAVNNKEWALTNEGEGGAGVVGLEAHGLVGRHRRHLRHDLNTEFCSTSHILRCPDHWFPPLVGFQAHGCVRRHRRHMWHQTSICSNFAGVLHFSRNSCCQTQWSCRAAGWEFVATLATATYPALVPQQAMLHCTSTEPRCHYLGLRDVLVEGGQK